jgi:phospholipid transport system substrate-binding protein
MTNRWLRRATAWMAGLALISVLGVAEAGPATDVVKAKQTALFDLLKTAPADGQKKREAIYDELFDYKAMAESSLGAEWSARTDAERTQFSDLLKQLVRASYERNLKKILNFDVEYVTEEKAAGAVVVKTKSKPKNPKDEPVEISFKLVSTGGKWKDVDIITEGVSLISSYRSQFVKIIKKDGFPTLIQKMKDKIAKGDV